MQSFEEYLFQLNTTQIIQLVFVENIFIFLLSIGLAEGLDSIFKTTDSARARPLQKSELALAGVCVFNNAIVTLIGYFLWKNQFISIKISSGWHWDLFYFLILFLVMDLAMFVFHRLAHIKLIYNLIHRAHHNYVEVRPLTLFALHPIETYGFGALWLIVLFLVSPTWVAVIIYLIANVIFGSLGHMATEPFPIWWQKIPFLNLLTTRTFHALHHQEIEKNYGFYTIIWDQLGKSLAANYIQIFEKSAGRKIDI